MLCQNLTQYRIKVILTYWFSVFMEAQISETMKMMKILYLAETDDQNKPLNIDSWDNVAMCCLWLTESLDSVLIEDKVSINKWSWYWSNRRKEKRKKNIKNKESPNHINDSVNLVTMTYKIAQVYAFESNKQQPRPCSEFGDWHINFDAENIYSKR